MARNDRRRDYRHFPTEYASVLHEFAERGIARLGPMTHRDARSATRDLYRFKMFLLSAIEHDPSDEFARELSDIFKSVKMTVESTVEGMTLTNWVEQVQLDQPHHFVVLSLNPIVAAVRQMNERRQQP